MGCTQSTLTDPDRPISKSTRAEGRQPRRVSAEISIVRESHVATEEEGAHWQSNDPMGSPLIHSTASFESPADCQGVPEPPSILPDSNPQHAPITRGQPGPGPTTPAMSVTSPVLAAPVPNPFTLPNGSFSMERDWMTASHSEQLQRSRVKPIGGGNSAVSLAGSTQIEGGKLSRTTLTAAGVSKQSGSLLVGSGVTQDLDWLELHSRGRASPGFSASEPDDPRWWDWNKNCT